jgi:hypothetical protein
MNFLKKKQRNELAFLRLLSMRKQRISGCYRGLHDVAPTIIYSFPIPFSSIVLQLFELIN